MIKNTLNLVIRSRKLFRDAKLIIPKYDQLTYINPKFYFCKENNYNKQK